ncbi:astacin-like [Ciona intestinalis]
MIRNSVLVALLDLLFTFTAITGLPITEPAENQCSFNTAECTGNCGPLGHQTDDWDCPISCECKSSGFIEGDIKFDDKNVAMIKNTYGISPIIRGRGASSRQNHLWTDVRINGRIKVPFVMSNDTSTKSEKAINEAVAGINGSTCVDFINRTTEEDYIEIVPKSGCWSYVGRIGGRQEISIGRGCEYMGTVQHEFLHALGFWHEQSRPDRDDYVTIRFENIETENERNFFKQTSINSLGSPYDTKSIMHYHSYAFSKNGNATIVNKTTNEPIVNERSEMSHEDTFQLNALYDCQPATTETPTTTATTTQSTTAPATTDNNVYDTTETPTTGNNVYGTAMSATTDDNVLNTNAQTTTHDNVDNLIVATIEPDDGDSAAFNVPMLWSQNIVGQNNKQTS